jgi:hypothetical protein
MLLKPLSKSKRIPRPPFKGFFSVLLWILWFSSFSFGQINPNISPETRAYLFHIVRKSPILENNMGQAFEYKGPMIYLKDSTVNYDSLDRILINNPEFLTLQKTIIEKCPKGVLLEASNKTAIYEMCSQIKAFSLGDAMRNQSMVNSFFKAFVDTLPKALASNKTIDVLTNPSSSPLLRTNISVKEKIMELKFLGFSKATDQKAILEAQSFALNKTIGERTIRLFELLGGMYTDIKSVLVAAGDGSYTHGLLEERDVDDFGNFNQGLPKAIGLFPYHFTLAQDKRAEVNTKRYTVLTFNTFGPEKLTQFHFDVWGYNSKKQTMVIVEKGDHQYPLFGSRTTRFLTPDSSFTEGTTFMKFLSDLKNKRYVELNELLNGKLGYDERIKRLTIQLEEIETRIDEESGALGNLYTYDYKVGRRASKKTRKMIKAGKGSEVINAPRKKTHQKPKGEKQDLIVSLNEQYDYTYDQLETLIDEREPLQEEYNEIKSRIQRLESMVGQRWQSFTEKDGLYTFADGTTFDVYTQDLSFLPTEDTLPVTVKLISIPEDYEEADADEVMMHISCSDAVPYYDADFNLDFNDVFSPDAYEYNRPIFRAQDSSMVASLFKAFKKSKFPISLDLLGNGIGCWKDSLLIRDPLQRELPTYPLLEQATATTARDTEPFKSLRKTTLQIKLNRSLHIRIVSTTDPVKSNVTSTYFDTQAFCQTHGLSKNELLSALRTRSILLQVRKELIQYATVYLTNAEAKKFIDALDLAIQKSAMKVGTKPIKLPKLKD